MGLDRVSHHILSGFVAVMFVWGACGKALHHAFVATVRSVLVSVAVSQHSFQRTYCNHLLLVSGARRSCLAGSFVVVCGSGGRLKVGLD